MTERASVLAVGLMSGTSLDGVTGALVRIEEPAEDDVRLTLRTRRTIPYGHERSARIAAAIASGTARDLALLHADLGEWLAECVETLLDDAGVAPASIAFIASHGQTIWHEPRKASLQLGNPAVIAERTGIAVIADFRSRDVAAGGEGAPLVPRADRLLFAGKDAPRALLNIGGIANMTLVPKRGHDSPLLAFDTRPGVMVIDACVQRLFPANATTRTGRSRPRAALEPVLEELLGDPFFAAQPPAAQAASGSAPVRGRPHRALPRLSEARGHRCHGDRADRPRDRPGDTVHPHGARTARRGALGRRRAQPNARGGARTRVAGRGSSLLRRPVLRRRRQGSGGLRFPRLPHVHRAGRQRARRDRCVGPARPRLHHAGVMLDA